MSKDLNFTSKLCFDQRVLDVCYLVDNSGEPGGHEHQVTQPGSGTLLLHADQEGHLPQSAHTNQLHGHLQHHLRLLLIHTWVENHPIVRPRDPKSPAQGFELAPGPHVPHPAVFPPAEKQEAGGGLQLRPVPRPGAGGERVVLQRLPPGRRLQVRLTGPVGMATLGAAQAQLPPAGVVQGEDELPPRAAHLAAAAQVGQREVG